MGKDRREKKWDLSHRQTTAQAMKRMEEFESSSKNDLSQVVYLNFILLANKFCLVIHYLRGQAISAGTISGPFDALNDVGITSDASDVKTRNHSKLNPCFHPTSKIT